MNKIEKKEKKIETENCCCIRQHATVVCLMTNVNICQDNLKKK